MLVNPRSEIVRVATECDIHQSEETVHTCDETLRGRSISLYSWRSAEDDDLIGQVGCHDEIMLDNERSSLGVHNPAFHDTSGKNTLFRVKVRRGFINQVQIARLGECDNQSDTLKLTTRQSLHLIVEKRLDIKRDEHFSTEERRIPSVSKLQSEQIANRTLELGCNRLRLVRDVESRQLKFLIVWLEYTCEYLDHGGLTCTVLAKHDDGL